jgi:hypothetical protein
MAYLLLLPFYRYSPSRTMLFSIHGVVSMFVPKYLVEDTGLTPWRSKPTSESRQIVNGQQRVQQLTNS